MKVIVHIKPDFSNRFSKYIISFTYSIKTVKNPEWWTSYRYTYWKESKHLDLVQIDILNFVLNELYESEHDLPNCEDCDMVEAPINYRQMEQEDRD